MKRDQFFFLFAHKNLGFVIKYHKLVLCIHKDAFFCYSLSAGRDGVFFPFFFFSGFFFLVMSHISHSFVCLSVNMNTDDMSLYRTTLSSVAMTIKKKIQTKYRLPVLNWTPLKPQQLKGTIFSDLDDEKLYNVSTREVMF